MGGMDKYEQMLATNEDRDFNRSMLHKSVSLHGTAGYI